MALYIYAGTTHWGKLGGQNANASEFSSLSARSDALQQVGVDILPFWACDLIRGFIRSERRARYGELEDQY